MATVKFILRNDKKNKEGKAPICLQYVHKSRKWVLPTGKTIEPKFFKDGKVYRHENASTLNRYFNTLENKVYRIVAELEAEEREPDVERVRDRYRDENRKRQPESEITRSIIFQWKEFLTNKEGSLAPNTVKNQKNSMDALKVFLFEKKKESHTPEKFSLTNIMEWENWMHKHKNLSTNTIARYKKHFKAFLKFYTKVGGELGFKLDDLRYKESPGIKVSLTESELKAVQDHKFKGGRIEEVRDLFVLQCHTGLRISDLKRAGENIEGNKIKIVTQKTGSSLEIPITPTIRHILTKYKNQLPIIPDPKYNEWIKSVLKEVIPDSKIQIKKDRKFMTISKWEVMTSHDAIRTFITLSAERGMSVASIARITGKSVQVLLRHYLNESQVVAEQEFSKAWGESPLRIAK